MTKRQLNQLLKHIKPISVRNMQSSSGNDVANQFIISTPAAIVFQSYSSIIAMKTDKGIVLDGHYWDYSVTTGKYRNQFLGETKAETQRKIDNGTYTLANLN